ncbi:hypothetical protein HDU97_004972 [Phlyctochytrium planicorne]|nr:hypothetical protein HDU97_004972 [Phlyctochytrium planicorne]
MKFIAVVFAALVASAAALPQNGGGLGKCSADAAKLVVGLGVDSEGERAQEVRAVPGGFKKDPIFGNQGSALAFGIVANFICDRLGDQCKAGAGVVSSCRAAQKKLVAEGAKGGKNLNAGQVAKLQAQAAEFNRAIGIGGGAAPANNNVQNNNKGNNNNNNNKGNNNQNKGNNNNQNKGNQGGAKGGLGSCSAAAAKLVVGKGVDPEGERAQEVRAVPGGFKKDAVFGNQGSALAFGIVANFICDRLGDQCKAGADTVAKCRNAQKEVAKFKGGKNLSGDQIKTLQNAADAFNRAIGI